MTGAGQGRGQPVPDVTPWLLRGGGQLYGAGRDGGRGHRAQAVKVLWPGGDGAWTPGGKEVREMPPTMAVLGDRKACVTHFAAAQGVLCWGPGHGGFPGSVSFMPLLLPNSKGSTPGLTLKDPRC